MEFIKEQRDDKFHWSNQKRRLTNVIPYSILLHHLKSMIGQIVTDDNLMGKIYLYSTSTVDLNNLTDDDVARMTKSCKDAMNKTFYTYISNELNTIQEFLKNEAEHTVFTIPTKALNAFKEYLNITVRYGTTHNSEALSNLSYHMKSENLTESEESQTAVSVTDLRVLLGLNDQYLSQLNSKLENPNSCPFSAADISAYIMRTMLIFCRMAIPEDVYSIEDASEVKHFLWNKFEDKINQVNLGYNTDESNQTLQLNHLIMLNDKEFDVDMFPKVKFSDDAALAYVVRNEFHKHIERTQRGIYSVNNNCGYDEVAGR